MVETAAVLEREALGALPAPLEFTPEECEVYRAAPTFSTFDWARQHMRMVSGPYKGQLWRPDVSPFARAIMDLFDTPSLRKLFIIAPSQTTKTTIAYACVLASLCRKLRPVGIGMPDELAVKRKFDETLSPYVRSIHELRRQLHPDPRIATTRGEIVFASDERIYGMWAGSESRMSSVSMEVVVIDEEDAYTDRGAVQSMEERVTAYERMGASKIIRVSKPCGTEEESTIWRDAKAEGQVWLRLRAKCPACGTVQEMDDSRIKAVWPQGEERPEDRAERARQILRRDLARYECEQCGYMWSDAARDVAIRRGGLVPDREVENPQIAVVQIRSWESPLIRMSKVLHDWFVAQNNPRRLKNYDNNHKAVPYRVVTRETPETALRERISEGRPALVAPAETWALTCGIDAQMTGFWFVVRAWARNLESWLVHQGFLQSWNDVEDLLRTRYPVQGRDDVTAPIWRAGIDIGGGVGRETEEGDEGMGVTMSQETKLWLQENYGQFPVYGVKGAARPMAVTVKPSVVGIDPAVQKKFRLGELVIYMLDTKDLKDAVHFRLTSKRCTTPMWLHGESSPGELDVYVKQMTAERLVTSKSGRQQWDAGSRANHLFDCEVYAAACADPMWAPPMIMLPEPYLVRPEPEKSKRNTASSRLAGLRRSPYAR